MSERVRLFPAALGFCAALTFFSQGCDRERQGTKTMDARPAPSASEHATPSAPPNKNAPENSPPSASVQDATPLSSPPDFSCPAGMRLVPGGKFWVGTEREVYDREENPQFSTRLPRFCADEFEVSTEEFETCVAAGKCDPLTMNNKTCNRVEKERGDHPINCITFKQAEQVCQARGARLPTEIEWEYMARGGEEMRDFPWGNEAPDGHTCWKHPGTCERGAFPAGAFGLHDVVGNVWEWTSSFWGRYPWPEPEGDKRVYRGGSWSRRFEKWMRPSLRNRLDPEKAGSHLGARCVKSDPTAECPYGRSSDGQCRPGVDEVKCLDKEEWNGVRCAPPGSTERCGPGTHEEEGFGCVRERVAGPVSQELDTASVTRARSPEFDADCEKNAPGRPHAYRFEGGGHLARNAVGKSLGCKNRDVGVGFNSSCCP